MYVNEKHKSSVFSKLFSNPDVLRELYSALSGVTIPADTLIDINTLSNVLIKGLINDVSFTIGNRLIVLIEHQSSINENMPLRLLLYITHVYEKIINRKKLYHKKRVKIPAPEFIVLYNGSAPYPEQKEIKLSEAFMDIEDLKLPENNKICLELIVKVYNINYGQNTPMLERSVDLAGYSFFINKLREYQLEYSLEEAMEKAIKYCIEHNVLKEFLEENSSEVMNMLLEEWTLEDALVVEREEALEEGREAILEIARKMKAGSRPLSEITEYTGLSPEVVEQL